MLRVNPSLKTWIAALCLAAQGLVLGHYALVEHTRCAEHGELVHVGGHADAHGTEHGAGAAADVASDLITTGEAAHDESHEHCATCSERRKVICAPAPIVATVSVRVDPSSTPVVQVFGASRAVYWIAPKTSPPV